MYTYMYTDVYCLWPIAHCLLARHIFLDASSSSQLREAVADVSMLVVPKQTLLPEVGRPSIQQVHTRPQKGNSQKGIANRQMPIGISQ